LPPEGSVDAKEENEFFRDTGIRAGPEGRRLLKEFQARYSIRWRGKGGMRHMWQHRRLEYLDGAKQLRLNYSLTAEIYGWFIFLLGAAITVLVLIGVMLGRVTGEPWQILYLPLGMAMAWVAVDHMVLPESTARKLRRRMAAGCHPPGADAPVRGG
jgi:predicted phage tail protein